MTFRQWSTLRFHSTPRGRDPDTCGPHTRVNLPSWCALWRFPLAKSLPRTGPNLDMQLGDLQLGNSPMHTGQAAVTNAARNASISTPPPHCARALPPVPLLPTKTRFATQLHCVHPHTLLRAFARHELWSLPMAHSFGQAPLWPPMRGWRTPPHFAPGLPPLAHPTPVMPCVRRQAVSLQTTASRPATHLAADTFSVEVGCCHTSPPSFSPHPRPRLLHLRPPSPSLSPHGSRTPRHAGLACISRRRGPVASRSA